MKQKPIQTIWGIHAGKTGDADTLFLEHNVIALGWDQVTYLFGSADPLGADHLFEIYSHKRSEEFCLPLEPLGEMFPESFLFVAWDTAPAHQSRDTKRYLADKQDVLEVV